MELCGFLINIWTLILSSFILNWFCFPSCFPLIPTCQIKHIMTIYHTVFSIQVKKSIFICVDSTIARILVDDGINFLVTEDTDESSFHIFQEFWWVPIRLLEKVNSMCRIHISQQLYGNDIIGHIWDVPLELYIRHFPRATVLQILKSSKAPINYILYADHN